MKQPKTSRFWKDVGPAKVEGRQGLSRGAPTYRQIPKEAPRAPANAIPESDKNRIAKRSEKRTALGLNMAPGHIAAMPHGHTAKAPCCREQRIPNPVRNAHSFDEFDRNGVAIGLNAAASRAFRFQYVVSNSHTLENVMKRIPTPKPMPAVVPSRNAGPVCHRHRAILADDAVCPWCSRDAVKVSS